MRMFLVIASCLNVEAYLDKIDISVATSYNQ
jgi:hypothetical protein